MPVLEAPALILIDGIRKKRHQHALCASPVKAAHRWMVKSRDVCNNVTSRPID
jgi:hypothetical protein